jgi:GxxExxY protein
MNSRDGVCVLGLKCQCRFDTSNVEVAYKIDMLVEEAVVVELKTVTSLLPIHEAQLLTHLRLSNHRLGLLLNFYVTHMRDGIKRIVNGL